MYNQKACLSAYFMVRTVEQHEPEKLQGSFLCVLSLTLHPNQNLVWIWSVFTASLYISWNMRKVSYLNAL